MDTLRRKKKRKRKKLVLTKQVEKNHFAQLDKRTQLPETIV